VSFETARYTFVTVEPCSTCGGRRRHVGFVPHEHDPNLRIDLYRCFSCDARSAETTDYYAGCFNDRRAVLSTPRSSNR
jgi:hypothetical protein